jgi:hypothetical protein
MRRVGPLLERRRRSDGTRMIAILEPDDREIAPEAEVAGEIRAGW